MVVAYAAAEVYLSRFESHAYAPPTPLSPPFFPLHYTRAPSPMQPHKLLYLDPK